MFDIKKTLKSRKMKNRPKLKKKNENVSFTVDFLSDGLNLSMPLLAAFKEPFFQRFSNYGRNLFLSNGGLIEDSSTVKSRFRLE